MEMCEKERKIAERAAEVAARKYDEKVDTLRRVAGVSRGCLQSRLHDMARRLFELAVHPQEDVLGPAGIRILKYWVEGCGDRHVRIKVGESIAELRYSFYGAGLYSFPSRPSVRTTATETLDAAAAALRQLDELIAVVPAYAKMLAADKAKVLAESEERAEKAAHQLELLEKM